MAIEAPGVSPTGSEFPMGESWIARHRTCINFLFRNIYLYMCVKKFNENSRSEFKESKEGYVGGSKEKKEGKDEVTTL